MNLSEKYQSNHYNKIFLEENYKHENYGSFLMRKEISNNFFVEFPKKKNLGNVLEIGCGNGMLSQYLKGNFNYFFGIDIASRAINYANLKFSIKKKIKFKKINVCSKKINIGKFDTIIFNSSLHHMPLTRNLFSNIKKNSKKNTLIIFLEPHSNNKFFQLIRFLRTKIDKNFTKDQCFFVPNKLNKKLEKEGFVILKNKFYGFFTPAFSEVSFPPELLFKYFAKFFIFCDRLLFKILPNSFLKYSWIYGTYCKVK